jgi:hypothetical protein
MAETPTPAQIAEHVLRDAADWIDPGPAKTWPASLKDDHDAYVVACANRGTASNLRMLAYQYGTGVRPVQVPEPTCSCTDIDIPGTSIIGLPDVWCRVHRQNVCTCPDIDVSTPLERPGTSTVKGLNPSCRAHRRRTGA